MPNSLNQAKSRLRIGADVGGTFTDVVVLDAQGQVRTCKLPSTPPNFEQAILQAVEQVLATMRGAPAMITEVAHATTVATNAVLEHRGARTALVTTRGFRDILELRRIRAPQLYDLTFEKPAPLVERHLRFELSERISASGEVLSPIAENELERLVARLQVAEVESIAVCFLHAYAFPQHEQQVGAYLRKRLPGAQVSLSCEVLRERREYERTATTVVNSYVRPIMQHYLGNLRRGLFRLGIDAPLLVMQSAGGLTPERDAAENPVFALESGPAAGVIAAAFAAAQLGIRNAVSFDMGGTTAKASLIEDGQISYSPEYEVGASLSAGNRRLGGRGELIRAPTVNIAEVGAGGGSLAMIDAAGGLRVGPQSAGALPGPVCYGRGGTQPTLTDANVVLGYIRPGKLADGQVSIDAEAARRAIHDQIAAPLNMSLLEAAEGIHRIANARTMRALREVSTERGRDPRDFTLIAFGGSGPIHAAGLSAELRTARVIIPPLPGLFSALGLLFAGVEHHDARSCRLSGADLTADAIRGLRGEMHAQMLVQFRNEGFSEMAIQFLTSTEVRFRGQTSEIRIPLAGGDITDETLQKMLVDFENEHERLYGHRGDPDNPLEVVIVRLIGRVESGVPQRFHQQATAVDNGTTSRRAYFGKTAGEIDTQVVRRSELINPTPGPVLIDEYDSTIVVPPGFTAHTDEHGNLHMTGLLR